MTFDALSEDEIVRRSDDAAEPSWLRDRRLTAYKRYVDQPWPNSRTDEFWRSTPFSRRVLVDRAVIDQAPEGGVEVGDSVTESLDVETAVARVVDGELVEVSVPASLAQAGLVVTDLSTASRDHPELVERHLGALTTTDPEGTGAGEDRTITANDAAWTAGVFVHVPPELELEAPVGVHVHVTRPGVHLPRVLVVVGHHARAIVYLEHTSTPGVDALVDEVVEVIAEDGAKVDLASLQGWQDGVTHLGLQKTQAHRDASVRHVSVTTGGTTVRLRPECDLVGPGAEVRPLGVYFADEGQWFDLQPYVRHLAPRAGSDVLFKGALQGHSRTVFRGNIFVHKDAVGTVTDENNRTLILTEGARADATPFLEIECADITAGHGSATGQIDASQLFYLEARGISRHDALRLIVFGFFREVLKEVSIPGIEDAALADIASRVETADFVNAVQVNDASLQDVG